MKFKIDENLPRDLAEALIALGYAADTVQEEGLAGAPDPVVLNAAIKDDRILLTLDKGFGNVISYPPESHPGIVLFRPGSLERPAVLAFILDRLPDVLQLPIKGRTLVVTPRKIRAR